MSFLFATAYDRVVGAAGYAATIRELDAQYPGARAAVESTITPVVEQRLESKPQDEAAAGLTVFAPAYREVCRRAR